MAPTRTPHIITNSSNTPMPFRNMGLPGHKGELPIERSMRIRNASFGGGLSGAMGAGDRGSWQSVPDFTGNPYDSQDYVYRWRQYVHLYELSWEARKIIRIPVEDALRKPWEALDIPEQMAKGIMTRIEQLNFMSVLKRSLMLERLLGGCLTFLGLDSANDDVSKVYHPHEGAKLRFANAIPISRISRISWDTNPMSEGYMRPDMFLVNGNELHTSRALVWDGEPLFDPYDFALTNFRSNLAGFGPSKLAPIWDDIIKAVGTRQAAYQLIQTNNAILVAINDLQDISSTAPGQANLAKLKDMANQLSLYKAAMIDGDKTTVTQSAASFGSVPELIITFIQILSAASDIPATRFLGQAPGGLNATGESDLENYYNVIDAYQQQRIAPALHRVYDILGWNMYGQLWKKERGKLNFKFPPLWNASELEEAQTHAAEIDNVMKLHEAGLVTSEKVIEELNSKGALSVTLDKDDLANLEAMKEEQVDAAEEIAKLKEQGSTGDKSGGEAFSIKRTPTPIQNTFGMEFLMGMKDEQEHLEEVEGDQHKVAQIVMDHLKDDPEYYSKLRKAGLMKVETSSNQLKDLKEIFNNTLKFQTETQFRNYVWDAVHLAQKTQNIRFDLENNDPIGEVYEFKVDSDKWEPSTKILYQLWSAGGDWENPVLFGVCQLIQGSLEKLKSNKNMGMFVYIPSVNEGNYSLVSNPKGGYVASNDDQLKNDKRNDESQCLKSIQRYLDQVVKGKIKVKNTIDLEALPSPSQAQIDAGNYQKHHLTLHGMQVAIENPKGSLRSGMDPNGVAWESELPAHYGYIKRTEGADGDHVDIYIGDNEQSELVFIIDQLDLATGEFDEHKCILGCLGQKEAEALYQAGFSDGKGKDRLGAITPMHLSQFKQWLAEGDTTQPFMNEADFDESKHKRASDGKFGSGGATKAKKPHATVEHTAEDTKAHSVAKARGLKVPPAWTNVWVNPDPKGDLQVKGKDEKGRAQYLYSANFRTQQDVAKFNRLKVFASEYPKMMNQIVKDMATSEEAKALYLIAQTGFRVGSERDTKAEAQAYGATTLTSDHVKIEGSKVLFGFTGKKGVSQLHEIDDPKLASMFTGKQGKILDTNDRKVRDYLDSLSSTHFKVKDFRTYVATSTALEAIQQVEAPINLKSYAKAVMSVAKIVADKLGNTPKMAKDAYIDPTVFRSWQAQLQGV